MIRHPYILYTLLAKKKIQVILKELVYSELVIRLFASVYHHRCVIATCSNALMTIQTSYLTNTSGNLWQRAQLLPSNHPSPHSVSLGRGVFFLKGSLTSKVDMVINGGNFELVLGQKKKLQRAKIALVCHRIKKVSRNQLYRLIRTDKVSFTL